MNFIVPIILSGVATYLCFAYIKWKQNYWSRHQIPFLKPKSLYASLTSTRVKHLSQEMADIYQKFQGKSPMVGLYFLLKPVLLVTDLHLAQNVLIKDFQYFQDRGLFYNEKDDPLSAHLFAIEYEKWKPLRSKLMPTFSSAKMKFMFPTVTEIANKLIECLSETITVDSEVEVLEWMSRYTTDVIGSCAFGIDCNSLKEPHTLFRQKAEKVFKQPKCGFSCLILINSYATIAKLLGLQVHHKDVTDFFMNLVKDTITFREENKVERKDFMNLLMELKNSKNDNEKLTTNEIAAQAFLFFLAGYETSATALSYCLYELAMDENKHIRDKATSEISSVLEKHNGNLTFEALNEMTYIEQVMNETLRIHPPTSGNLLRVATKDYNVPNVNFVIPKGMQILIPTYAIQHDPAVYEKPDIFDPDRFSTEQIKKRPSCSFLSFGDGPKNCIGLKFGMLETRIALVKLLENFEFSTCSRTDIPIKFSKTNLLLSPENGIWLKVNQKR